MLGIVSKATLRLSRAHVVSRTGARIGCHGETEGSGPWGRRCDFMGTDPEGYKTITINSSGKRG